MSRRFQFSLKSLLVVTLVVAAFFGGLIAGQRLERHRMHEEIEYLAGWQQHVLEAEFRVREDLKLLKESRKK